jgi:hypothetical protein
MLAKSRLNFKCRMWKQAEKLAKDILTLLQEKTTLPTLHNISLKVEEGSLVAVVGQVYSTL